ncbi:MAG: hypothetical protein B6I20_04725 [Bacteroidetes bacterium 4572_117]|nr:MAG: hypothetical protein B6I20_04725 [Bacteroidetes bacterium 4572_117]
MIQRIQTIYIFLSSVLIFLIFIFPISEFFVDGNLSYIFRYRGIYELTDKAEIATITSLPLAVLFGIILVIGLINIFLFKNRGLQMRLCIFNIMLMLGSIGLAYYYIYFASVELAVTVRFSIVATFPLISAILTYMAFRGIYKDEKLVKSLDRIR